MSYSKYDHHAFITIGHLTSNHPIAQSDPPEPKIVEPKEPNWIDNPEPKIIEPNEPNWEDNPEPKWIEPDKEEDDSDSGAGGTITVNVAPKPMVEGNRVQQIIYLRYTPKGSRNAKWKTPAYEAALRDGSLLQLDTKEARAISHVLRRHDPCINHIPHKALYVEIMPSGIKHFICGTRRADKTVTPKHKSTYDVVYTNEFKGEPAPQHA